MIFIKPGVKLTGIKPEMCFAKTAIDQCYESNGIYRCVITSGLDGVHKKHSKHYLGQALDFRTLDMDRTTAIKIVDMAQQRLGNDFDVILESNHIHCEFDPK